MTRRARGVALLALGVVACTPPVPQIRAKVLVIGIDGVRPDVLAQVATPHLDALISSGTFSDAAVTGRPSVSGPGWSSFLTGVWPDKHGVHSNDLRGHDLASYPDFLTRMEQVRPDLSTFVAADWLPIVADDSGGPVIGDAVDVRFVVDGYERGWLEADSLLVDAAVEHLLEADPDALFVYLGAPDELSHATRSIGDPYRDAIARSDHDVGRLISAIEARATRSSEDWLIVVSTDHGRLADGGHGGDTPEERTIFFLVSGASALRGSPSTAPRIVDVAPTALVHLGIELDDAWELDGRPVGLAR